MSAEQWQEIGEWFHRLVEADPAERVEILADLDAKAPELKEDVLALLESDRAATEQQPLAAGGLQGSTLWDEFAVALEEGRGRPQSDQNDPLMAGPFKVGRVLGEGGMAVVHLAERVDNDFKQVVAIKRLTGVDRKGLTDRLLAERRILAELRHPNIAQLIDGGTDSTGRPYLALEYVDGLPIDEYCNEKRASLDERIRLFIQACDAVGHAHSHLVVHRDLKPSNILVDGRGHVKLLDFGIAKILDPARDDGVSMSEVRPLTPRYAAPEQFLGSPSTTATDIYGLGIVLFELLVGRLPYDVSGTDISSYRRAVLEQDAVTPLEALNTLSLAGADTIELDRLAESRSTTLRGLRRALRGDLRALFEKVLHKDPAERYESAQSLVQELENYLAHRPLHARDDALAYRARKFARRNRYPIVAAALVLASLSIGLVAALTQAAEAREQAELAQVERGRAVRVKDLLASIIIGAEPHRARTEKLTSVEFLDRGVAEVLPELEENPEDMVDLLQEMQILYRRLGELDKAADMAAKIIAVFRGPQTEAGRLAQALYNSTLIEMDRQEYERVRTVLEEVLVLEAARFESGEGPVGDVPDQRPFTLQGLGTISMRQGDLDEAKDFYGRAIDGYRLDDWDDDPRIAVVEGNLGFILIRQDRYEEAQAVYETVVAKQRKMFGDRHGRVSISLSNLGRIALMRGDLDKAEGHYQESLSIDTELYGPVHPNLSVDQGSLGKIAGERGDYAAAVAWAERALASLARRSPENSRRLGATASLANALVTYAENEGREERVALARRAILNLDASEALLLERSGAKDRRVLDAALSRVRAERLLGGDVLQRLETLTEQIEAALGSDNALTVKAVELLASWRAGIVESRPPGVVE